MEETGEGSSSMDFSAAGVGAGAGPVAPTSVVKKDDNDSAALNLSSLHSRRQHFYHDSFFRSAADDDGVVLSDDLRASMVSMPTMQQQQLSPQRQDRSHSSSKRWMTCAKAIVGLVWVTCAILIGYLCVQTWQTEETNDWQQAFSARAHRVQEHIQRQLQQDLIPQMQILARVFASTARATEASFPNFTLSDFPWMGQQIRQSTGASVVAYAPFIGNNETARLLWEAYSVQQQQESFAASGTSGAISPYIYDDQIQSRTRDAGPGPYSPLWQQSPPPTTTRDDLGSTSHYQVNYNLQRNEYVARATAASSIHTTTPSSSSDVSLVHVKEDLSKTWLGAGSLSTQTTESTALLIVVPVQAQQLLSESTTITKGIVGHIIALISWNSLLQDILSEEESESLYVVLDSSSSCTNESDAAIIDATYRINGQSNVTLLGLEEDLHEIRYNHASVATSTTTNLLPQQMVASTTCPLSIRIYPSRELEDAYTTDDPTHFTMTVLGIFFGTLLVFIAYDCFQQRQQQETLTTALRATSIVRSLFPQNVAEQLHAHKAASEELLLEQERRQRRGRRKRRRRLRSRDDSAAADLQGSSGDLLAREASDEIMEDKPIADLFPSATVFFADIAGFTAWSSSREPEQVFVLLENLYRAFDKIATKRQIFKVETIGDCYVAVCGLPNPNKNHAIDMCRFAVECREKFKEMRCKLEVKLGPDTGDLDLRIGMHSGPVTAGVLRGDRARFQLFGDTVNTASRMESNGEPDRIHLSGDTAKLLTSAGKGHWISARKDKIVAKGKGEMETFWLLTREKTATVSTHPGSRNKKGESNSEEDNEELDNNDLLVTSAAIPELVVRNEKFQRMIDWNSEILLQMLKTIVASRSNKPRRSIREQSLDEMEMDVGQGVIPYEEVGEPPALPPDYEGARNDITPESVYLDPAIAKQLHLYIEVIASMYRDNSFHSFEHASHVSMSAVKLLSRVVGPLSRRRQGVGSGSDDDLSSEFMVAENSFGITSDPLTQFAVILAAVVHDCDHRGVPNEVLAREEPSLAGTYKHKSIAEQNSLDVAWRVLMGDEYRKLRRAIYTTPSELRRFRQILVNTVMATDLFDREMAEQREERWGSVFVPTASPRGSVASGMSTLRDSMASTVTVHYFRANVVLEYLIQASDVAHTMQHWHVYKKWNQRLFQEIYKAWRAGRVESNPADVWYQQELNFFDEIVIPLAKRLKESGAFGVSSDEYLNYAEKNREEWASRGHEAVQSFRGHAEGKELRAARRRSSGYGAR